VAGGAALGPHTDPKFALVRYERDGSLEREADSRPVTDFGSGGGSALDHSVEAGPRTNTYLRQASWPHSQV
jgi:hypothetical protein